MNRIYLDHAAATPMRREVLEAMLPAFTGAFGNPSSVHSFGREALSTLRDARDTISRLLGCASKELIFTSGGTESDNLALIGAAQAAPSGKNHMIVTSIEHHAVLHTCSHLERMGWEFTYLNVDTTGLISLDQLQAAIRPETWLLSMMIGNNEVGTIQPLREAAQLVRAHGVLVHSDAVQAFGMMPLDVGPLQVDLLSLSAHKIGGPKGMGALYVSPRTKLEPQLYGGSQERKRRAGTENVAGAVGFARAAQLAADEQPARVDALRNLQKQLLTGLTDLLGAEGFVRNGPQVLEEGLPHIVNISFPGIATETMLMNLDLAGIAAASGSACTSGSLERSHVLTAMGLPDAVAGSAVRFSFGHTTTTQEIDETLTHIETIVRRLRR